MDLKLVSPENETVERDLPASKSKSHKFSKNLLQPYLEILIQPQPKFKFTYLSERTAKHEPLLGNPTSQVTTKDVQIYPTVKLHNYPYEATIRCTLVCETPPYFPHAHQLSHNDLTGEIPCQLSTSQTFINLNATPANNHSVTFDGLNITYTGKKFILKEILSKMAALEGWDDRKLRLEKEVNDLVLRMNLNMVSLYFEALIPSQNGLKLVCPPVVSMPIQHKENTQRSELRIVRIDKYASYCTGDEEVFVLVEKVDKRNIQIKFFQENEKGIEIWKAYGKFNNFDVHHQYAIVFKTPPYRNLGIDTDVDVWVQLERPSDGATSPQIPFKYKPIERLRRMPRNLTPKNEREGNGGDGRRIRGNPEYRQNLNQPPDGANVQNPAEFVGGAIPGPSSSIRQGSNIFPCDPTQLTTTKPKEMALSVALSVGESLHSWAETSDFNVVLQKLRHLLCLVDEKGDNALHTAILNGQQEPFLQILKAVSNSEDISSIINDTNLNGLTPLAMAVLLTGEPFVRQLLLHKADISIPNFEGDTPIHLAVKQRDINTLNLLLSSPKAFQVINKFNYDSLTPLHLAAGDGFAEGIEVLCRANAALTCQEGSFGRTPLHMAIERRNFNVASLLLKNGIAKDLVNIQNYRGDTALHGAVSMESPNPVICALLLYYGANPTIENYVKELDNEGTSKGQTVLDLVTNLEIQKVLNADQSQWEEIAENDLSTSTNNFLTFENLNTDSGIGIESS